MYLLLGGGAQLAISVFVAEIADNAIRGQLGIIYQISRRMSVLFAILIVNYLSYKILGWILVAFAILFYSSFILFPSTPQHFLRKRQDEVSSC